MYVGLVKLNENNEYIFYRLHTRIEEVLWSKNKKEFILWKTVYGYSQFNKKTEDFFLDNYTSHKYFLEAKWEKIYTQGLLMKVKQNNEEYPLSTCINTGG